MLLDSEGVNVVLAADGAEAMRVIVATKPDALVIDIGLPDCDGFELYDRIVSVSGVLPVVFSSGHADLEPSERFAQPFVRILSKPYTAGTLIKQLEDVCSAAVLKQ